ncbi:MAG TPA: AraC family transcriptional regulator [Capsulimonadaceae bacterium]|jgi:AraC-like DNA-binding protein
MAIDPFNVCADGDAILSRSFPIRQMQQSHRHSELEFNLVTSGTVSYLVGDMRYDLAPCSLAWFFPGQDHIIIECSSDLDMWLAIVSPSVVHRSCISSSSAALLEDCPEGQFCRTISALDASMLTAIFRDVETVADSATYLAGLGYSLLQAWEAFERSGSNGVIQCTHPAVRDAVRLIRDTCGDIELESVAESVGVSLSRLRHLFREQVGITMVRFRNRQRVERYLALIRQKPEARIIDAALDAGFGSYPQFHRVFVEVMGCAPRDYGG